MKVTRERKQVDFFQPPQPVAESGEKRVAKEVRLMDATCHPNQADVKILHDGLAGTGRVSDLNG